MTSLVHQALLYKNDSCRWKHHLHLIQCLAKIGLIRLCCFFLHVLSSERSFAVLLNKPFHLNLPGVPDLPRFRGSHADLLVLVS
jgi:hypothetical protein